MNLSRRCSLLCALVVIAHGGHYATWSWQPPEAGTDPRTTRAVAPTVAARFESDAPQQEGRFSLELSPASVAVTGVAYFRLERPGEEPEHVAIFAHTKDYFVGYHLSRGHNIEELSAALFGSPDVEILAQLRRMADSLGGDEAVAVQLVPPDPSGGPRYWPPDRPTALDV